MAGYLEAVPEDSVQRQALSLRLHQEALNLREAVGRGFYELATRLWTIKQGRLWQTIDPDLASFEDYLEQYNFGDWGRSKAFALLGQVRDLVPLGASAEALGEVGWSKVEAIRPAVTRGLVPLTEALVDAKALGRKDLLRKYATIVADAEGTSVVPSCHDCVNLHRAIRGRGDLLIAFLAGKPDGVEVEADWRYCPAIGKVWVDGPKGYEAEKAARDCKSRVHPDQTTLKEGS